MSSSRLILVAAAALWATIVVAADLGVPKLPSKKPRTFADMADVSAVIDPPAAKPGQVVTFKLTISPKPGAWTYPTNPPDGQASKNVIILPRSEAIVFVGPVTDPPGWKLKPPDGTGQRDRYYADAVTWEVKAIVAPKATEGKKTIPLTETRLQACNNSVCLPLREPPVATVEVLPGPAVPVPPELASLLNPTPHDTPAPPTAPSSAGSTSATTIPSASSRSGLSGLLLAATFWGFVSLVTPCVFPMIPITVSLFLKQSHHSAGGAVKLAAVYCTTIVVVLGAAAAFLLPTFKALSVHPYTNALLGVLLVVFALSLFGMFELTLPGFLLRATERRRGTGGIIGTVFGALAFSIVSFTCVAPFLGGFAGMAASGQHTQLDLVLAGIVFAIAFASPFFVLALFPSMLKTLPKSGGWLDTVKVVMGFLEIAAAVKFFRTAELVLLPRAEYFTYDVCIAAWVSIAGACGLYLLNLFRLPHDEDRSNIGVLRMIFALGFLGLAVYLTPALFQADGKSQRPSGLVFAWVDSFLLPEPSEDREWKIDLKAEESRIAGEMRKWEAARSAAKAVDPNASDPPRPDKRFIFVDFTGTTCTNCKLNEREVFPLPAVQGLMQQYTRVALYTDIVPATMYDTPPSDAERKSQADANAQYQLDKFGTQQLPLYVILEPQPSGESKVVAVYEEGKINDLAAFVEFLRMPLGQ